MFRRKSLESSLAQINTEHVELLVSHSSLLCCQLELMLAVQNELVHARLKNEEVESELVRYKLLYALLVCPLRSLSCCFQLC
jgi:hypothetical protein